MRWEFWMPVSQFTNNLDKVKHLPAWDFKKAKPKSEVAQPANKDSRSGQIAFLVDPCHLKHSDRAKHLQKHKEKGRAPVGQRQRRQRGQSSTHGATIFSFANGTSKIPGYSSAQSCSKKTTVEQICVNTSSWRTYRMDGPCMLRRLHVLWSLAHVFLSDSASSCFLDAVSRLPGMAGEASDAVSEMQGHMSEALQVDCHCPEVHESATQSKTKTNGTRLNNCHLLEGLPLERKSEEALLAPTLG